MSGDPAIEAARRALVTAIASHGLVTQPNSPTLLDWDKVLLGLLWLTLGLSALRESLQETRIERWQAVAERWKRLYQGGVR